MTTKIQISWRDNSTNETSFKIFRSPFPNLSFSVEISSITHDGTTWSASSGILISQNSAPDSTGEVFIIEYDEGFGGDFYYAVSAINEYGSSSRSLSNEIAIDGIPLPISFPSVELVSNASDSVPQPPRNVSITMIENITTTTLAPTTIAPTTTLEPTTTISIIGELREVTGVWTNGGNTTIIGEILEVEYVSPSNGKRYLRTDGTKIWSSHSQYLNQTKAYIAPTTTIAPTTIAPNQPEFTSSDIGREIVFSDLTHLGSFNLTINTLYTTINVNNQGTRIGINDNDGTFVWVDDSTRAFGRQRGVQWDFNIVTTTLAPTTIAPTTIAPTTTEESEFTQTFCLEYSGVKRTYEIQTDGNYLQAFNSNSTPSSVDDYPVWKTNDNWWVFARIFTFTTGSYNLSWHGVQGYDPRVQTGSTTRLSNEVSGSLFGDLVKTPNLFNPSSTYYVLHGSGQCPS